MPKKTTSKPADVPASGLTAPVYSQEGKSAGQASLPAALFDLPWNGDLVHQVLVSMQSNQRANTAQAKGRGAVRGGGKKPWQQKGTGRARHGSIRSPLWRGGGVTHGPSVERNYTKKINAKMKMKALLTVLSQKRRDGEVALLDQLNLSAPKTSAAQQVLNKLAKLPGLTTLTHRQGQRALFLVPEANAALIKSFRNLPAVAVEEIRNLNPISALTYQYLIFANPAASWPVLTSRAGK